MTHELQKNSRAFQNKRTLLGHLHEYFFLEIYLGTQSHNKILKIKFIHINKYYLLNFLNHIKINIAVYFR